MRAALNMVDDPLASDLLGMPRARAARGREVEQCDGSQRL
jgi:hypothetical protein